MEPAGGRSMIRRHVSAVLVGLVALVAATEWHRVFGWDAITPILVAAVLPAAISLVGAIGTERPRSIALTGSISMTAMFAALVVATSPAELTESLIHGWSRLLTTTIPAPTDADLITTPIAITWLSALTGTELVRRVRLPLVGLVPPLIAYALALVYTAGSEGSRLGVTVTIVVLSFATAYTLRPIGQSDSRASSPGSLTAKRLPVRRWVGAMLVVALSLAAAVQIGPHLPFADARDAFDPREDQEPPVDELPVIDPMSMLAGWAVGTDEQTLFTVRAPEAEPFQLWRLAVLDRYDPNLGWSVDETLTPAGEELPGGETTDRTTIGITQAVTIGDLAGPWLPAADRPTWASGLDVFVDAATGVLATNEEVSRGLTYEVRSAVPVAAQDCTFAASGELTEADLSTPVDADIAELATRITQGVASPCERARRIEEYLASDVFKFNPKAFSGSALRNVRTLLGVVPEGSEPTGPPAEGTSEQYATTYALLARAVGLPSRVVVGFRAGTRVGDVWQVRPTDAFAWVEVRFQDLGWVFFDPTPQPGDQPPPPELPEETLEDDGTEADRSGGTGTSPVEGEGDTGGAAKDRSALQRVAMAVGLVLIVGSIVLGLTAALVAARRRRRRVRRRQAIDPAQQIVGAWRECLDELRDAGIRPPRSSSAGDCIAQAVHELGPAPAGELEPVADLVNAAFFGSDALDQALADDAWLHADRLAELAAAERTRAERAIRALDVRVLARR